MSDPTTTTTSFHDTMTTTTIGTTTFTTALFAGGIAGTSVDIVLFPIDTIKTRLQAPHGFWKSGGFRGIYNGLGAAAIGSAPGAALFFSTYETMKPIIQSKINCYFHNSNNNIW
jgi:solute carrier family 25 (mitochondrial S-adenosylmethionine transporter), member 26